ncbi:ATP-binding protein [Nocardia sp.]|uniref:ATP-binding protein n=1 Tax=Nocardia sp. TaxID=1821 RepID=UPI002623B2A6|nr:ATP-binding protein [Nocardia sp.]
MTVVGAVVADLVHLIAELVDNATTYSPPTAQVETYGNPTVEGVIVEVEDQGIGMSEAERAEANELLCNPTDFDVTTLTADPRLGMFVVWPRGTTFRCD